MEITLEKKNDCEATLGAVATAAEVQVMRKKFLASYGQIARVDGFRPGKVPASVLLKRFGKEIEELLKEQIAEDARQKMFEENKELRVLSLSDMEVKEVEGGAYEAHSNLTLLPAFELPKYEGIEVTVESTEVSDEEVQEALQKYAESNATHEPVERPATVEDMVVLDFKTSVEGKPTAEYCGKQVGFMEGCEDFRLSLTDTFLPGLSAGLVGAAPGEHRDINDNLSDTFPIAELQGKEIQFACDVKQVLEKRVPEITVELLKDLVPGESMAEMREEVRKNMKASKERNNENSKADQITDYLADKLDFSLPESLVESQTEEMLWRKRYAEMRAGNFNSQEESDSLRNEAREDAIRSLHVYFALQQIADKEKITVSDGELTNEIFRMAKRDGESNIKTYIRKLKRENRIMGIRSTLITSKVMDQLVKKAKVVPATEQQGE